MKKFYIKFYKLDSSKKREFGGEVIITSPHLKRLIELLPEGVEVQHKSLTYKRVEDELYVSGIFRCIAEYDQCWSSMTTENCPDFTKCEVIRTTQSFFTHLRHLSEDLSQEEDESSEDGAFAPSSSPSSEGEDEAKDKATSQSLESEEEDPDGVVNLDDDQITPDQEDNSGSSLGECSSSQEDASIQDEPRVSGSSEVASNGDESGEAEDGSGESGTPTVVPESSSEDFEEDKKPSPEVESQSEASGSNTGAESSASAASSEEDNLFQGEQGKERAGEDETSLDSCPAGALSGQEESCYDETGQDSLTSSEESGSLWELEFNSEEDQHSYGGGGGQAKALSAKDSNSKAEKQVALLLQKLFSSIEDIFRKREGNDFWDAKKVICSSAFAPQNLPTSKFSRPSFRKISLWVDVSGSVDYLANFIISMIVAASKDKDVQVVVGSEAHPEKILPDNFYRLNKNWQDVEAVWQHGYTRHFEDQAEIFLRKNKLEQGSLIVIWSDYMDIHAEDLSKLARLFRSYKVVWLCSHNGKDHDYFGNESIKLNRFARQQGHLFLWGIDSPEGIRKAVKYLNIKKCLSS